jgi:hypothetical protein
VALQRGSATLGAAKTRTAERASHAMYTSRSVLPDQQASGAPIDNDWFSIVGWSAEPYQAR